MKQKPVIQRLVARVLLFDQKDQLLLLFDPDPDRGGYWYPPGGRIEDGESPEEAARRELAEEVGLDVVEVGPVVLRRRARFTYGDRQFDQDEWHLLGRVAAPEIGPKADDNEAAAVAAHRWWSLADLRNSTGRFFPEGLVDIAQRLCDNGPPTEPWMTGALDDK
jgi:8-oxo-dGTP pyrophosphatase MutT (NUDIX family)